MLSFPKNPWEQCIGEEDEPLSSQKTLVDERVNRIERGNSEFCGCGGVPKEEVVGEGKEEGEQRDQDDLLDDPAWEEKAEEELENPIWVRVEKCSWGSNGEWDVRRRDGIEGEDVAGEEEVIQN